MSWKGRSRAWRLAALGSKSCLHSCSGMGLRARHMYCQTAMLVLCMRAGFSEVAAAAQGRDLEEAWISRQLSSELVRQRNVYIPLRRTCTSSISKLMLRNFYDLVHGLLQSGLSVSSCLFGVGSSFYGLATCSCANVLLGQPRDPSQRSRFVMVSQSFRRLRPSWKPCGGRSQLCQQLTASVCLPGRASLDVQGNPAAELQTIARCLWEAQHYVDQVNWLSLGSVHVPALNKALQEKNDFLQATAVFFPLCLPLKNSSLFHIPAQWGVTRADCRRSPSLLDSASSVH